MQTGIQGTCVGMDGCCRFSYSQVPRSQNQRMDMEVDESPSDWMIHPQMWASCSQDRKLCWPRGLGSKVRNAATSSHSLDSTEVTTVGRLHWTPQAKKGATVWAQRGLLMTQGKSGCDSTTEVRKSGPEIQQMSQGISPCCHTLRLRLMENYNHPMWAGCPVTQTCTWWITPPDKEPRAVEGLPEGPGNTAVTQI